MEANFNSSSNSLSLFFIRNGFVEVDWMDNITFTFTNPLSLFRNGLEEADWMDNATRRKAEEKVNHVVT